MDQQVEDHAHRIGQKKELRIFINVGFTEEEIPKHAKRKMGIDAKVIQPCVFNNNSMAYDR